MGDRKPSQHIEFSLQNLHHLRLINHEDLGPSTPKDGLDRSPSTVGTIAIDVLALRPAEVCLMPIEYN